MSDTAVAPTEPQQTSEAVPAPAPAAAAAPEANTAAQTAPRRPLDGEYLVMAATKAVEGLLSQATLSPSVPIFSQAVPDPDTAAGCLCFPVAALLQAPQVSAVTRSAAVLVAAVRKSPKLTLVAPAGTAEGATPADDAYIVRTQLRRTYRTTLILRLLATATEEEVKALFEGAPETPSSLTRDTVPGIWFAKFQTEAATSASHSFVLGKKCAGADVRASVKTEPPVRPIDPPQAAAPAGTTPAATAQQQQPTYYDQAYYQGQRGQYYGNGGYYPTRGGRGSGRGRGGRGGVGRGGRGYQGSDEQGQAPALDDQQAQVQAAAPAVQAETPAGAQPQPQQAQTEQPKPQRKLKSIIRPDSASHADALRQLHAAQEKSQHYAHHSQYAGSHPHVTHPHAAGQEQAVQGGTPANTQRQRNEHARSHPRGEHQAQAQAQQPQQPADAAHDGKEAQKVQVKQTPPAPQDWAASFPPLPSSRTDSQQKTGYNRPFKQYTKDLVAGIVSNVVASSATYRPAGIPETFSALAAKPHTAIENTLTAPAEPVAEAAATSQEQAPLQPTVESAAAASLERGPGSPPIVQPTPAAPQTPTRSPPPVRSTSPHAPSYAAVVRPSS